MSRSCHDLDAEPFFDIDEIRSAYLLTDITQPVNPNEVLRLIASLGEFLGRKGNGEPGAKVTWLKLKEAHIAAKTSQKLRASGRAGDCA